VPKRGAKRPTVPSMALAVERESKALSLRQRGYSYQKIADELGITMQGAADCIRRAVAKLQAECSEKAEEVRQLELDRLDAMLMGLWSKAEEGDPAAVDRVLRIQERRAKYLGLDVAQKVDITTVEGIDAPRFVPMLPGGQTTSTDDA
jgi:hypothetical protein